MFHFSALILQDNFYYIPWHYKLRGKTSKAIFFSTPSNVFRQIFLLLELLLAVAWLAQVVDVLLQLVEEHLSPLDATLHLYKKKDHLSKFYDKQFKVG